MRTLVDLPKADMLLLNKLAKAGKVSRTVLVREAVNRYLAPHKSSSMREFLGICPEIGDGLAYQERIRDEWDR